MLYDKVKLKLNSKVVDRYIYDISIYLRYANLFNLLVLLTNVIFLNQKHETNDLWDYFTKFLSSPNFYFFAIFL